MEASLASDIVAKYVNGDAGYIAAITFFVCEALFNALPIEKARMKQLASIVVGGVLGFFLLKNAAIADNVLQGMLSGGAATVIVAKFKKPSATVEVEKAVVVQAQPPVAVPAAPEPVEHL